MKTFEKVKVILFVLLMMVTGTTFTACGGSDDDEENWFNSSSDDAGESDSGNTGGGSGNTGGGGTGGSGGNTGGSSTTYEKPEIGLEDWTCYTTAITVRYRIYNQDKAKVTSAKGYYGTTSASKSVSASVAGSLITIRITGLKKGTTYYVKCSATGKAGTATSETTRFITDY